MTTIKYSCLVVLAFIACFSGSIQAKEPSEYNDRELRNAGWTQEQIDELKGRPNALVIGNIEFPKHGSDIPTDVWILRPEVELSLNQLGRQITGRFRSSNCNTSVTGIYDHAQRVFELNWKCWGEDVSARATFDEVFSSFSGVRWTSLSDTPFNGYRGPQPKTKVAKTEPRKQQPAKSSPTPAPKKKSAKAEDDALVAAAIQRGDCVIYGDTYEDEANDLIHHAIVETGWVYYDDEFKVNFLYKPLRRYKKTSSFSVEVNGTAINTRLDRSGNVASHARLPGAAYYDFTMPGGKLGPYIEKLDLGDACNKQGIWAGCGYAVHPEPRVKPVRCAS